MMIRYLTCFLPILLGSPLFGQPQMGGGVCSNAILNGAYFWELQGSVIVNAQVGLNRQLARTVMDGNGSFSGTTTSIINGTLTPATLSGTYAIDSNCGGTFIVLVNSQFVGQAAFQVINAGGRALIAFSTPTSLVTGSLYRQSADSSTTCNTGSISGGYGFLLTGLLGRSIYLNEGNLSADGKGNVTGRSTLNIGGFGSSAVSTGTYAISSTCIGTARLVDQAGNVANYLLGVANDGATILFLQVDLGTSISGMAAPQFVVPQ